MRYQHAYTWFVFLSAMDLMLTWIILHQDGRELNPLAKWVIDTMNLWGLVGFKFSLVVIVVMLCEVVGYRRPRLGHFVACLAVAITSAPVTLGMFLLIKMTF